MPANARKNLPRLRRRTNKKRAGTTTKSFVKKVQAIIHKDVETKEAFNTLDLTAFNSGINASGDAIQILPNISQGTSENSRIGDRLSGMSLNLRGHMLISTANNSPQNARLAVRLMVVQPRYTSNLTTAQTQYAVWMPTLLKKGATTTAFTGTISDLYAPINTEAIIKYYDKVIYITMPYIYNQAGATNVNTSTSWDMVNSTKFFNINLKMKNKLLKYDTTLSSLQPTNYAPIFLLGYCHLDGSSVDVLTTQVSAAFDAVFKYEDA